MSVNPKERKSLNGKGPLVTAHGSDNAPMLFFDGAVAFGVVGHIVQIELAATVQIPVTANGKAETRMRTMIVGHLRGTHAAMAQLGDAIEKALMMTPIDRSVTPEAAKEKSDA